MISGRGNDSSVLSLTPLSGSIAQGEKTACLLTFMPPAPLSMKNCELVLKVVTIIVIIIIFVFVVVTAHWWSSLIVYIAFFEIFELFPNCTSNTITGHRNMSFNEIVKILCSRVISQRCGTFQLFQTSRTGVFGDSDLSLLLRHWLIYRISHHALTRLVWSIGRYLWVQLLSFKWVALEWFRVCNSQLCRIISVRASSIDLRCLCNRTPWSWQIVTRKISG